MNGLLGHLPLISLENCHKTISYLLPGSDDVQKLLPQALCVDHKAPSYRAELAPLSQGILQLPSQPRSPFCFGVIIFGV